MYTIQLQKDTSFEQYQMAIRLLEAIDIKIAKKERVPEYVLHEIEKGLEDAENGNVIASDLVHKQMKDYVQNCLDK